MTRAAIVAALLVAGCSEHGHSPDAGPDVPVVPPDAFVLDAFTNPGFFPPAQPLAAWTETQPGVFAPATLDLSCAQMMRVDPPTTVPVTLTVTVRDFQSDAVVADAVVTVVAFAALTQQADAGGVTTFQLPQGVTRLGYSTDAANARITATLDARLAPAASAQAVTVRSVSKATAQTLPSLVGASPAATDSIVLGTITDCQGHTLSNAIATINASLGPPGHLPGADTYYFSESVGLPVRHATANATSRDGRFMVIGIPPAPATPTSVEVYGFRTASELAAGSLRLIAHLPLNLTVDRVFLTRQDPWIVR